MEITVNPYNRSVAIDGDEIKQSVLPFPDHFNHLATVSCTANDEFTIIDVKGIHRYVSHFIEKEYYYKHLPSFIEWHRLEKQAQVAKAAEDHTTLTTIIHEFISPEIDELAQRIAEQNVTSFTYNQNIKTLNIVKGQLTTLTALLPEVTDTHPGLMTPMDVSAIRELQTKVYKLENLLANPNADPDDIEFSNIPRFSNTSYGLVKGTDRLGGIYAELDGSGSLNGYDELMSKKDIVFMYKSDFKALENPIGSGQYPSLIGKHVVIMDSNSTDGNNIPDLTQLVQTIQTMQTKLDNLANEPKDVLGIRAWGLIAANGEILRSEGIETSSREGTGRYLITLSTPAPDTNYAILVTGDVISSTADTGAVGRPRTTTQFQIAGINYSNGAGVDNKMSFAILY